MSGKRGKNDAVDAAAICEAVSRANMRFVPIKDENQQIILCLHRTRQGFVEERTAIYNRLRGLVSEFGVVLPLKVVNLRQNIAARLEDLPSHVNRCVGDLLAHADRLDALVAEYDRAIAQSVRTDDRGKRLMQLPGIGPTTASALLASIGGGHDFANGRQVAAWIGLVPGQYSSGGKARLGRITKAGDHYLRSLLVMGARAVLSSRGDKAGSLQSLGAQSRGTAWLLARSRGHRRQECATGLGSAQVWRVVSTDRDSVKVDGFPRQPGRRHTGVARSRGRDH